MYAAKASESRKRDTMFVQTHWLTFYPPSNLNRDELGRPKTAIVGDTPRLRISSQSLKRAWRTSATFESELNGHIGTRTKRIGLEAKETLVKEGVGAEEAEKWAAKIANVFGKVAKGGIATEQLVHISPAEQQAVNDLVSIAAKHKREPTEDELKLLRKDAMAVDIAMFGRMLADATDYNVDASVQVAHAFTVHPVSVEEDYFTAVDDLKPASDDAGAAHIGVNEFGAGIFYGYVCIDRTGLVENLGGDQRLAERAISALMKAIATVGPAGKQNSFASRAAASYMLVEKGSHQPRSLALAFLDGVRKQPLMSSSIESLRDHLARHDKAYGTGEEQYEMDVGASKGTLGELSGFAAR